MKKYGCVMLPVPLQGWRDLLMQIEQEHVFDPDGEHGFTIYPHITILYGLHQVTDTMDIMLFLDSISKPMEVEFTGLSTFENQAFDVLKFDVHANELAGMNRKIRKRYQHTLDYQEYKPHMTVAFLKKGTAWHYKNLSVSMPPKIKLDLLRFINADGHETIIKLR